MDSLSHYTFDGFVPEGFGISPNQSRNLTVAYETTKRFAEDPSGWLVLLGGYGCGKTHLAAAIANQCIEDERMALFVVVPDLLDHLRATYSPHSTTTYDERFDKIRSAPLLILDDLGAQAQHALGSRKAISNLQLPLQCPLTNCDHLQSQPGRT